MTSFAVQLLVDKVATYALLQLRDVCGLRSEYCTCGMLEGSALSKSRHLCVHERCLWWLPSCSGIKSPRIHYCICVLSAGSAQNIGPAGCLKDLAEVKVATYECTREV